MNYFDQLSAPWRTKVVELFARHCGTGGAVQAVADIGCGDGEVASVLANGYPAMQFTGIDVRDDELATARGRLHQMGLRNLSFVREHFLSLRQRECYDVITFSEVYEHLVAENQVLSLRLIGTMLRGDGCLIFTCPNGRYVLSELERKRDFDSRYRSDFFDDMTQTLHWLEPSREEIEKLFSALGYDVVESGYFNLPLMYRAAWLGSLAYRVFEPLLNIVILRLVADRLCKGIYVVARKNPRSRLLRNLSLS